MKKQLNIKTFWLSILSVMVLGISILLALGTIDEDNPFPEEQLEYLGDDVYRQTYTYGEELVQRIITGERDKNGRWWGPVKIIIFSPVLPLLTYVEEIYYMRDGLRHGQSILTYVDGTVEVDCYKMGNEVDCEKSTQDDTSDTSSFYVLSNKYPWYSFALNACGFDSNYVASYMDTLEIVLNSYEFEEAEFDDYYDDATNILEETPYDSIIVLNSFLTYIQGYEALKNAEFRLAVIDRHRSGSSSTYDIVKMYYPNYLLSLGEADVSDEDFKDFCNDVDDSLALYDPLDPEDPCLADSVDARLFEVLFSIAFPADTSSSSAKRLLKSTAYEDSDDDLRSIHLTASSVIKSFAMQSTSSEVGMVVLYSMLIYFNKGDIMRQSVREAWLKRNGIVSIPSLITVFSEAVSATSVSLQGYVFEDGGAEVTERGIEWATYYNPGTDDNILTTGTGTGQFTITVDGLTEGTTYYARTFATNSAGTAYGNCISFVAEEPSEIIEGKLVNCDFTVYPNPASTWATFSFQLESSESVLLSITDMKGQQVLYKSLGRLPRGRNQIQLDLSGLKDGMYTCVLTNGTTKATHNLIITH